MAISAVSPVWTSTPGSMAYETARTRWPGIIQRVADEIERANKTQTGDAKKEGERLCESVVVLKTDIETDKSFRSLSQDGGADIDAYNAEIERLGPSCSWLNAPWLFAECYIYRRIQNSLALSQHWQNFDVFKRQKDSTISDMRVAVEEVAALHAGLTDSLSNGTAAKPAQSNEEQKLLFLEMTHVALWGNASDLSLLSSLGSGQIQSFQGREAMKKNQRNIVDDDSDAVWAYLTKPRRENRQIDIVLDNAGFELFTDLVYSSYLLYAGLADQIVLHVKSFPWFVSDALNSDIDSLLQHLESSDTFPDRTAVEPLLRRLKQLFKEGKMSIRPDPFWTTGDSFHDMDVQARKLFEALKSSALVVFKGDLNYRKLTKDGLWPHTTPFADATGCMGRASGVKILTLRTNKADVCVGVEDQARVKALDSEAPDGQWLRNGKYAVISFSDGS